jgi:enoyl-CoA hydratase/carnithine racemase
MIAKAQEAKSANAKTSTGRVASTSPLILLREDVGSIAILTLNRPEARNSLSEALLIALGDALTEIAHERKVRAVVLAANGPAFSAGHDLKEFKNHRSDPDRGRAYFKYIMELCSTVMQQIVNLPQPVVAAVQGVATAAGCQLVGSCDLAVASAAAKFATPGVNVGLFCSTPMVALSRNIPRKQTMEMLLTGEPISATTARDVGLVNRVVPHEALITTAVALGHDISGGDQDAVQALKSIYDRGSKLAPGDALELELDVFRNRRLAPETIEARREGLLDRNREGS